MNQHALDLLPAYHDGQLDAGRRDWVKAHLLTCPACRASLEELERLSSLLKSDAAPELLPPEQFAAQVLLRLPRTAPANPRRAANALPRWLLAVPLIIIAGWAFLEAALLVASALLAAGWFFGLPGSLISEFGSLLLLNLVVLVFTAMLWTVWLAFWYIWNKQPGIEPVAIRI